MNALTILNNTLSHVTPNMHKVRYQALHACVASLLGGASASVTGIGRGIRSPAYEKHCIKRADRLVSNRHLFAELPYIYTAMAYLFGSMSSTPVVLVDWSDLDEYKRHFLLRASVVLSGRSITLYQEVHPLKTKEKPAVHRRFLIQLKAMLGEACQPIIVTDAGFKTPWFREVLALGWHFVGRTRRPNFYCVTDDTWQCITQLYKQATPKPKSYEGQINRSQPLACRLVIYKEPSKGRHRMNRSGQPKRCKASIIPAKRATDPWLISTSLPYCSTLAKRTVKIYHTRMQIEEGFRDMKSRQYGLGFEHNRTIEIKRLTILILLATLASLVLILLGLTLQLAKLSGRYQANTTKTKRVLSLHYLGLRAWADPRLRISKQHWHSAIEQLKNYIQEATYAAN
jgi:hypothetical protein